MTDPQTPAVESEKSPTPVPADRPAFESQPSRRRRGGRGRKPQQAPAAETAAASAGANKPGAERTGPRQPRVHPLLAQLSAHYPRLFGETPLPLKRGIFQDLVAAHPDWAAEELKTTLGLHTRSTRYLTAVAAGQPRHDLAGQAVEAMAPEHVHHALLEVFKRRQQRTQEDLAPKLRRRLVQAFEASGLAREDYALVVRHRDEAYNVLLDEALAEAAEAAARDEALLRAFEASGAESVAAFADLYGRDPRQAQRAIDEARRRRGRTAAA
ncbi:MAG: RNA chaperone ProQ [Paracidovorax wautersii]|uniref:RNA chaperone ProQ n=1 Tax=Paracidovorax wautersii TaxID=1177982 RepID=A0A7V8JQU5_9BURK|nr:MAG: RNA chaperone ProQ [Paracidovorax wautersii]